MKKFSLLTISVFLVLVACKWNGKQEDKNEKDMEISMETIHNDFFDNFQAICGNSYRGEEVYLDSIMTSWKPDEIIMHVNYCDDNQVRIPLHKGNDHSRTWILTKHEQGLLFKHDHRHDDGTPDEITNYGGFAINGGTPLKQVFPAHEYEFALWPRFSDNEWTLEFNETKTEFSYSLRKAGKLLFQVDFDLENPI
jgi:hypothetical protein